MAVVIRKLQEDLKTNYSNYKRSKGSSINQLTDSDLDITLRLINYAMKMTASTHHRYSEAQFASKGTTPTHLIYGKISSFDLYFQTVLQIAVTPNV